MNPTKNYLTSLGLRVFFSAVLLAVAPVFAADNSATLTGNVANLATGNLLAGARVEIPALHLTALTDETGRYVFPTLPPGTHETVASYTGLDQLRATVTVAAGSAATHNFDLTAEIYKLAGFKVVGEREGFAAAITAERNADNVKNVVATDQFGNLPNLNAGEVAMRLPGVYGNLDGGGNSFGFTVRGMSAGLNTVTMDGALMTGQGGSGRSGVVNNITSTMFEQVEVTKGHRPDEGADSLGGTINFKSRSPLTLREKRRVTYSLMGRLAPSFTQQIPLRREHPFHQIVNLGWQEVFDAFGGEHNLGIALNLYHSETSLGWFNTTRDFQNTTAQPAFLWDYRTSDFYNHRRQNSVSLKTDYRLSAHTKLSALVMAVDHSEIFRRQYDTRAFVGTQDTVPSATSGIVPGYTDRITQVRPNAGSNLDITMTGPNFFFNRTRRVDLGAEQTFGPLALDYAARRTATHINIGQGEDGGVLANRISNVGWILDRTKSDLYPSFTQTNVTAANDITNPANYRPTGFFSNQNNQTKQDVNELRFNALYTLPVAVPASIKAGASWRDNGIGDNNRSRRWTYLGTTALPADPAIKTWDSARTGRNLPSWESSMFIHNRQPIDPMLWREDRYFSESNKFTGVDSLSEQITAVYVMGQARFAKNSVLAGVRTERTETNGEGYVRARVLSTAAQQAADPAGSAQRDYAGNNTENHGHYTKSFPSIHLTRDFTANLRAKLSWSTSFGRPALTNYNPSVTPNESNAAFNGQPTVTVNNPSLLPQTAANWDATLEYYFEPVGNFSAGFFRKTIKDYIVSGFIAGTIGTGTSNGYNGEYPGFTLLRSTNAGTAYVQGWECSYSQQLTFLPGLLKGLAVSGNYTIIDTHGNFGGATGLTGGQVAGFVPRTGNASVSWRYRSFSARLLANYASSYITSYSAASAGRNLYRFSRKTVTLGFAYQLRPSLSLTCDIDNLTNAEQASYRGIPDLVQSRSIPGTTITVGVSGRF